MVARIKEIEEGSPAARAGLEVGDVLVAAAGEPLRDVIDWRWIASEEEVEVSGLDNAGFVFDTILERDYSEDWGITFDDVIFDGVKTCRNACIFCFMRQLPQDARDTLTLRDDDYRLSFLSGNFVTLTNLSDEDIARIKEQHLSPLRVSLHATDAEVRSKIIGKHAALGLKNLQELLSAGIEFDAQIVLVPGINDGKVLTETLAWAYAQKGIRNVGIVPLGFTQFQEDFKKSYESEDVAKKVINQLQPFQMRALEERGYPWVVAADEFYRSAYGDSLLENLPSAEFYGSFDMFEDGIGIIRSMVDELKAAAKNIEWQRYSKCYFVCGEAMLPHFPLALSEAGLEGKIIPLPVKNNHFGGNVNVTGLLAGADIIDAILENAASAPPKSIYAIPDIIFNSHGLTVDDHTIDSIRAGLQQTKIADRLLLVGSNPIDYIEQIIAYFR